MRYRPTAPRLLALAAALSLPAALASAQGSAAAPTGYVSVHLDAANRAPAEGASTSDVQISTALRLHSPDDPEGPGAEFGFDLRYANALQGDRPERVSIYDAWAGMRFGHDLQTRVRAGHLWLPDLGTVGSLAGGLVEVGQPRSKAGLRFRGGAFMGWEPKVYDAGYVPDVRKMGAYAALESGYLRRHILGYTRVQQGTMTERSVLSMTNYVPVGSKVFAYQAAEYDLSGPADGAGDAGLSYFLLNVRGTASSRVELSGTYNRGRALDARTLTNDLLQGRAVTARVAEGLRYESGSGRVTVEVVRGTRVYASYGQDRTNRDDALTGRVTVGGYASNLLKTGFDVAASDAFIDRPGGSYHSRYVSVGHSVGRSLYVSGDYSTSLSVIQYQRGDGLVIETRPWSRRLSGSGTAILNRHMSLLCSVDYTMDGTQDEVRVLAGLSYRIR